MIAGADRVARQGVKTVSNIRIPSEIRVDARKSEVIVSSKAQMGIITKGCSVDEDELDGNTIVILTGIVPAI